MTAKAETEEAAKELIAPMVAELQKRFGNTIYTTDEQVTLEESIVQQLAEKHLKVTTVESCTGGALAARIINVSGASDVIQEGFITYSDEAKMSLVGVQKATIDAYTAVSSQTAAEMAEGGVAHTGSDVAVSVTGLAGPGGGTEEKPVGLVYIGCCYKGKTVVKEFHFKGNRSKIREQAVVKGLTLMRECIMEE